ncbi:MAG TPA: helix-turn-helix domain-containing protein [Solirubrobacteraceae bacterium]|nr:helix-turn-helix domain-containing protein [Solirubrobacteraceae bacterium]
MRNGQADERHRPTSRDKPRPRGVSEPNPRLLTSAEAADFLTLEESTLRDCSRRGIVPSVKIGRHLRFVEADLVGYLDGLRRSFQDPNGTRVW